MTHPQPSRLVPCTPLTRHQRPAPSLGCFHERSGFVGELERRHDSGRGLVPTEVLDVAESDRDRALSPKDTSPLERFAERQDLTEVGPIDVHPNQQSQLFGSFEKVGDDLPQVDIGLPFKKRRLSCISWAPSSVI